MDSKSKKIYDFTMDYIAKNVNDPIKELIIKDPIRNIKLPSLLVILNLLKENILKSNEVINDSVIANNINIYGKDKLLKMGQGYLDNDIKDNVFDKFIDEAVLKKEIIFYVNRELNWIIISILSASYLSANILLRSIFELLINWIVNNNDSMGDKIDSIQYLNSNEKKYLKKLWKKLNSWAHPFRYWEKNICPFYLDHEPTFHTELYDECSENLIMNFDLYISIAIGLFKINTEFLKDNFFYNKNIFEFKIVDRMIKYLRGK